MTETLARPRALDLYELLPAVYRVRDAEQGETLRALLEVISDQIQTVKEDVDGLYDDLFIETCAPWVIPYIGDLVANNPVHEVAGSRRADVAKTIHYRRRKGVPAMLEELARDVTGWAAHVVPGFEVLLWTQNLNHLRWRGKSDRVPVDPSDRPLLTETSGTALVRDLEACCDVDGPFDTLGHTVDVRPAGEDAHGIRKVGVFLWRLTSYPVQDAMPRRVRADRSRWHVSPLGNAAPLFTRPAVPDASRTVDEIGVPGPVGSLHFRSHPELYYTPAPSLAIHDGTAPVPLGLLLPMDLSDWANPPAGKVGVDVHLGRIKFGSGRVPAPGTTPRVSYAYGFSADIGGGPYERERRRFTSRRATDNGRATEDDPDTVDAPRALDAYIEVRGDGAGDETTIEDAIATWAAGSARRTVIEIGDSDSYRPAGPALTIRDTSPPVGAQLVIQARNAERPVVFGAIEVRDTTLGRLTLNGLLIAGPLTVRGAVEELRIEHCTLVPGHRLRHDGWSREPGEPSLTVQSDAERCEVLIDRCIVGPIRIPSEAHVLRVCDSIVDDAIDPAAPGGDRVAISAPGAGGGPAAPARIERSTVFGSVTVRELTLGSESIFAAGPLVAERRQVGCVRFSSLVRQGSRTPRRYRCQPDLVRAAAPSGEKRAESDRVRPAFTAIRYGEPAYAQLARGCAREIATGAEDGSEMGAFCHLRQPQREENLRTRLREYMPFGLEAGLIYVT
jgi:hypothetical protein